MGGTLDRRNPDEDRGGVRGVWHRAGERAKFCDEDQPCLAALDIQDEANRLAADVQRADGVALRLRVGLDSGQVIAGEIRSGLASRFEPSAEQVWKPAVTVRPAATITRPPTCESRVQ